MEECIYVGTVGGGFPSPAEGWRERALDITEVFLEHREATFFMLVRGDSMRGVGIGDGDLVVVDRALDVQQGSIIIALLNGGFLVKRYQVRADGTVVLNSAHPRYGPLVVTESMSFKVWGVVTFALRSVRVDGSLRGRLARMSRRGGPA